MKAPKQYPVSEVFWSIQGEGHLRGFQMAFVRLAGCSVGCGECDTDYSANRSATAEAIAAEAASVTPHGARDRWVWITGGEPADHDLRPLIDALRKASFSVAVATSGHKRVIPPVDWLSVSPHSSSELVQCYGNEIKVVPELNGLRLDDVAAMRLGFMYQYVQPLSRDGKENPESLRECLAWLKTHPDWSLSRQDQHEWRVR